MNLHRVSRVGYSALLIAAMAASTGAFAQEANSSGAPEANAEGQNPEIIVTAQFRQQNLQDTPIAITAVSGEMLEARSQTELTDITNQAPNVLLVQNTPAYGPSIAVTIRGVGSSDFNPALEPGVGIYVDEVYYATLTGSIMDLLDLDRVEVLRGPQGTLSGRNSIGGAIRMFSKKPGSGDPGYVEATYGSRNRLNLRAAADFNLADGVDVRLAGVSKRQKGYIKRIDFGCRYPAGEYPDINPANGVPAMLPSAGGDCELGAEGEVNTSAVRGQVRLRPTDTIDINLIADYTYEKHEGGGEVIVPIYDDSGNLISPNTAPNPNINPFGYVFPIDSRFICGKYCNYSNFYNPASGRFGTFQTDPDTIFEGWGVSGQIDWDLADRMSLTSITAYRTYHSKFTNDDLLPLAEHLGLSILDFRFFSEELRLSGALGANDELQYTLGGYYSDQKSIYTARQEFRDSIGAFYQRDPVPLTTKAVFGALSYSPIENLTFNLGARYTHEDKTYTFVRLTPDGQVHPILGALNNAVGAYNAGQFDYRANVQYRFSDNVMGYVQVATGYKGGGINPRPFLPAQAVSVGTEKLINYEVGLKSDFFDRRVRLNLAAFLQKYKDIQLQTNVCPPEFGTPCLIVANAGDAEMKGFEAELSAEPIDGLLFDASLSHLDFDYTRLGAGVTGTTGPRLEDQRPFTPDWKWSVGAQYRIELGQLGSLTPRFDVSHQGRSYFTLRNDPITEIKPFTLANARLTWRNASDDLDVALEVTNVFDKYYFTTSGGSVTDPTGRYIGTPGRPRGWALTVKKEF